ncbi:MAG TPA: 3-phosphoshikimate 1-carboxyvinyltransferase [Chitinophagaceae bacterium]
MIATVFPSALKGKVQAPASKSSMQRACAAALLSQGISVIKNPGFSNDDKAALQVIQDLGAVIEKQADGSIEISSNGVQPVTGRVNCGESGLGIRMFAPIIALSKNEITIDGEGSLLKRPMDFFDEILPFLGVTISSTNGKLPIQIKGPLNPAAITIDGSLSSQFLTGLLMAYAGANAAGVTIIVENLKSKPYIDLTLAVMKAFDLKLPENNNYHEFYFSEKQPSSYPATHEYTVEGDWSGAAFLLAAGAISGPITVKGISLQSAQADKEIMQALKQAGAGIHIDDDEITISPASLSAFEFDATDCPDLFPPLVALASYCKGVTIIKGVERLTHKESNRAITLQEEFGKMGVEIKLEHDVMGITGGKVSGANVHSHHDHRIAMACAVAALKAESAMIIEEANAINKSYPAFFNDLQQLGANINLR